MPPLTIWNSRGGEEVAIGTSGTYRGRPSSSTSSISGDREDEHATTLARKAFTATVMAVPPSSREGLGEDRGDTLEHTSAPCSLASFRTIASATRAHWPRRRYVHATEPASRQTRDGPSAVVLVFGRGPAAGLAIHEARAPSPGPARRSARDPPWLL